MKTTVASDGKLQFLMGKGSSTPNPVFSLGGWLNHRNKTLLKGKELSLDIVKNRSVELKFNLHRVSVELRNLIFP